MKRGHLDNVSELDLHGYTIKQTCEALSEFIYREQFEQFVRIIHGNFIIRTIAFAMNDTHKLLKLFTINKFRQRLTSLFYRIPMQIQFRYIVKMTTLQVVNFLKQHPQVLAFHSCPPKDGGTGAIFALLKQ
jgi:hypothetical protein